MHPDELVQEITKSLDDNKGYDIFVIDVRDITNVTDNMIICTANSTRHAKSLADKLLRSLREKGVKPYSGVDDSDENWVLVDFNDAVVHIMTPETREFYSLEKLWTVTEETRENTA